MNKKVSVLMGTAITALLAGVLAVAIPAPVLASCFAICGNGGVGGAGGAGGIGGSGGIAVGGAAAGGSDAHASADGGSADGGAGGSADGGCNNVGGFTAC